MPGRIKTQPALLAIIALTAWLVSVSQSSWRQLYSASASQPPQTAWVASGRIDRSVRSTSAVATTVKEAAASTAGQGSTPSSRSGAVADEASLRQAAPRVLVSHLAARFRIPDARAAEVVSYSMHAARAHHVDPLLFLALVGVESSFRADATSSAGAVGLAQVLPSAHPDMVAHARRLGTSLYNERLNVEFGARILAKCMVSSGWHRVRALQCYNGNTATLAYAERVMTAYRTLSRLMTAEQAA